MAMQRKIIIAVAAFVLLFIGRLFYDYFDTGGPVGTGSVAETAVRYRLEQLGAAIYERHSQTGRWPTRPDDLDGTFMALHMRFWKEDFEAGRVVPLWREDLKPDPKDNAALVLFYYNKGLISSFGKVWVCWGDFRTEYIKTDDLQAIRRH